MQMNDWCMTVVIATALFFVGFWVYFPEKIRENSFVLKTKRTEKPLSCPIWRWDTVQLMHNKIILLGTWMLVASMRWISFIFVSYPVVLVGGCFICKAISMEEKNSVLIIFENTFLHLFEFIMKQLQLQIKLAPSFLPSLNVFQFKTRLFYPSCL